MKKLLGITVMAAMSLSIFTACGNGGEVATEEANSPPQTEAPQTPAPTPTPVADTSSSAPLFTGGNYATGVGIITSTTSSRPVTEDVNGRVQVDSAIVTLTVDSDGIIVDAIIDAAQTRIEFNDEGELLTPFDTEIRTKQEQGPDYNMLPVSPIGAEWDEQIASLTEYIIGKPVDEVVNMTLADNGAPVDLTSSVTITIASTMTALERATLNLMPFDAPSDNIRTGMGISTNISASRQITEDTDARAEVVTSIVSLTLDEDDTILAVFIDVPQSRVSINSDGEINPDDLNSDIPTKGELGDAYNMRPASPIGKEWDEQIEFLTEWMVGKTVAEVQSLTLSDDDVIQDADLVSSVTIKVGPIFTAFDKAVENANR